MMIYERYILPLLLDFTMPNRQFTACREQTIGAALAHVNVLKG